MNKRLDEFLDVLGASEEPFGVHYTDIEPENGITPKSATLPSREDEQAGAVDWKALNEAQSCVIGLLWRARKKKAAAYFDASRFGCLGGAFYLGFLEAQLDSIACYVSTGIPGMMEGEKYLPSPEVSHNFFKTVSPRPAPKRFCVFKPFSSFAENETPELVVFFERPEVMSGLIELTGFVTSDFEAVMTPFGAGCSSIVTWPLKYLREKGPKAVLGGWDPSERKYLRHDELTLAMPLSIVELMLEKWQDSFLTTRTWSTIKQRIQKSESAWKKD